MTNAKKSKNAKGKSAAEVLRKFFERKQKANPSYSLRALARDLELSAPYVSRVLKGERRLAYDQLERAARVLDIDHQTLMNLKRGYAPEEVAHFAEESQTSLAGYHLTSQKDFSILRNWYYLAILDLTACSDFGGSEEEIARRLGLHIESTRVAVNELLERGHLVREKGGLKKAINWTRITTNQSQEIVRKYHAQMLQKAKEELSKPSKEDFERREISGITLSVDPSKLSAAKKMLTDSAYKIAEFLNEGETSEVYHLAVQLFPLTKR